MLRLTLTISKTSTRVLKTLCFLVLLGTIFTSKQSEAQSLGDNITIEKGDKVWIEGTAGPVDFTCHANKLSGQGKINNVQEPKSTVMDNEKNQINISVSIPVKSLDCGKTAMNKDMYDALKAERFPMISYQVLEASLADDPANTTSNKWLSISTRGIMEIAGVKDTTSVFVKGKISEKSRFQVKGTKNIHMDTYNIDPPSKMFGLIRAKKELSVHFNVTVKLTDTTQLSPGQNPLDS